MLEMPWTPIGGLNVEYDLRVQMDDWEFVRDQGLRLKAKTLLLESMVFPAWLNVSDVSGFVRLLEGFVCGVNYPYLFVAGLKKDSRKDKIGSKPDKNGKRGKAEKSSTQNFLDLKSSAGRLELTVTVVLRKGWMYLMLVFFVKFIHQLRVVPSSLNVAIVAISQSTDMRSAAGGSAWSSSLYSGRSMGDGGFLSAGERADTKKKGIQLFSRRQSCKEYNGRDYTRIALGKVRFESFFNSVAYERWRERVVKNVVIPFMQVGITLGIFTNILSYQLFTWKAIHYSFIFLYSSLYKFYEVRLHVVEMNECQSPCLAAEPLIVPQ
nr:hypothetical protein [Tanacetum cinerariifolium]